MGPEPPLTPALRGVEGAVHGRFAVDVRVRATCPRPFGSQPPGHKAAPEVRAAEATHLRLHLPLVPQGGPAAMRASLPLTEDRAAPDPGHKETPPAGPR